MRKNTMFLVLIAFITINLAGNRSEAQWVQGQGIDGGDYRCLAKFGSEIYAGSQYGGVFLSTNNGDTWIPKLSGLPGGVSVTRLMANGSSIFAGTSYWSKMGQGVYRSDDNGETWVQKNNGIEVSATPYFTDLYITGFAQTTGYIYTSTYSNGIYRSANNGDNWVKVFDVGILSMCSIGEAVFAGGEYTGGVHRSFDQGLTWDLISTGLPSGFIVYQLTSSGSDLYVRGSHGFYWSPNNGEYFISINNGITYQNGAANGAISAEGAVVYASTFDGSEGPRTYKSTNRGGSWTVVSDLSVYYVQSLLVNGSNVFAGHIGNYGITSNGGGVMRSLDNGATWASASTGLSGVSCRALTSYGTDILAGTYYYSGIYKSTNAGVTWTKSILPGTTPNYQILAMTTMGTTHFAGVNATNGVYKSVDNGVTWTQTTSIGKQVWALGVNAAYLFAGTSNDGMRRTSNNGTTWTTINSGLPTIGEKSIRAITVAGSKIYIGNSRGVFVSTNDGTTWTAANGGVGSPGYSSVKSIVVVNDTIVATGATGIIRSEDNGATWTQISATDGLLNTLIRDGRTIYAGGTAGVFVSNDLGLTWTSFNTAFPSIPEILSLYISNGVLYAGTYGQSVWMYPLIQAPLAYAVTGGGSYCQGSGGLPVGLSNSAAGVTYTLYKDNIAQVPTMAGTGSAITFGNQQAGTYTVTGTNSAGTTPMTGSAVITETTPLVVGVSITADANPVPAGTTVTFTATPVNEGTAPSYQWQVNGINAGTDNPVFTTIPANTDKIICILTSSETCTGGNPATSNQIAVTVIPASINLQNIIVADGQTNCYDAIQTIYVAGNETTFTVQSGGSATMIAGQNIICYPGTTVLEGGYLHGYISTEFCPNPSSPVAGNPVQTEVVQSAPQMVANSSIRIYPNPAGNQFTLELLGAETAGMQKLEIYSLAGVKVVEQDCSGSSKQTVSVVDLAPGVYVAKIKAGGKRITLKLVKM